MNRCRKIAGTAIFLLAIIFGSALFSLETYAADLALSVDYGTTVSCGTETTFTLTATGGSGTYKYYLNGIDLWDADGSKRYMVYDGYYLYKDYQESNTFNFTFYVSGRYTVTFYVMDMGTTPYTTKRLQFDLYVNDPNYPSVETIVSNLVTQCEAVCSTDYEKALWFHDWLIAHTKYDNAYQYCNAEGVLARGKGTCESYTRAYEKLLAAVGIEHEKMIGNGHCWSAIKLEGKWYQVDVTWDDAGYASATEYDEHMYFCITDELMTAVHSQHSQHAGYECLDLDKNYFIMSDKVTLWSNDFTTAIQTNLNAGETSFSLPVGNVRFSYNNYNKTIGYTVTAYKLSNMDWSTADKTVDLAAVYSGSDQTIYFSASYTDKITEHTHTWDSGTVTTAAGCNTTGVKTFCCTYSGCSKTKTETIPATGHNWNGGTQTKAPTDSTTGIMSYDCSKCSEHKYVGIQATGSAAYSGSSIYDVEFTVSSDYVIPAVWVDGIEVPATIEDGKVSFELPNTTYAGAMMYKYNDSGVPIGMKIWKLTYNSSYEATELTGLEDLIGYHGFSVRIKAPSGIRAIYSISSSTKETLASNGINGYKLIEYGSIYMIESNRGNYSFVKGGEKISYPAVSYGYDAEGNWVDNVLEKVSGRERYTLLIIGIPEENYSTNIAFRTYMTLEDSTGKRITVYSSPVVKSLYTVCKAYINRGDYAVGSSSYNYLNGIVSYVEQHQ